MRKTFRLEKLLEHHIPAILAIEKECNTAPWSERSFRNELDHEHGIFLVAFEGGQIVGYGGVWLVVDEAHITTVAVKPDLRRQGIGRRLVVDLLTQSKEKGACCSTLEVRASNVAAIELYRNLGYIETARRKSYYPDNNEDAIVMWLHNLDKWEPPKQ